MEIYDRRLKYIGEVKVEKSRLGWGLENLEEAQFFIKFISCKYNSDFSIKSI